MSLKMATLVQKSGLSKSTILYYIKEGLLPEPQKPKPNLHLYDEKSLSILEFIKYLQEHLHYSISEIKTILEDQRIDFENDSQIVINYLSALSGEEKEEQISQIRDQAKEYGIDPALIKAYESCAEKLAKLEYEMGAQLLQSHPDNEKNELQKLLFSILLDLKPYIFNQATIKEHKKRLKKFLEEDQK